jgi:hypothetical protein
MSDRLRDGMRRSDHWAQLAWAEAWGAVARLLAPTHARSARAAWRHAADGYDAYRVEYDKHMPASRWDYDYGRELSDAREHARARDPLTDDGAPLAPWIVAALDGDLEAALASAPTGESELDRAVLRALDVARHAAR